MIKPLSTVAVAIATVAALTTTATPAFATGSCSIILPANVSIASSRTIITGTPASDCAASDMSDASWDVSPSDWGDSFWFSAGSLSDSYTFMTGVDSVGVLHAVPTGASSSGGINDLTQNNPAYVVKYATWAYVASSRVGSAVYINALVKNFSANDLVRGSARSVYLQRYIGGVWQNMLVRTTSSTGQFTVGFIQPKVFQYRLLVTETSSAWGGRSGSTFR